MAEASSPRRKNAAAIKQITEEVEDTDDSISEYSAFDAISETDEDLAELWSAIKSLEDTVEEIRKEVIEAEMEERVDPGEDLCGISLIESHRKYVEEDVGTVIGRAANRGIDYTQFVSLKASKLSDKPELATIGRNEYTYFR